jgi:hypothetical protein
MPGTYNTTSVYVVSLSDLQPKYAGAVTGTSETGFTLISPDGASIYGALQHQQDLSGRTPNSPTVVGVVRFDLGTGVATDLASNAAYTNSFSGLVLSPDGSELAVVEASNNSSGSGQTAQVLRISSAGGAPAPVPLTVGDYTLCGGTYYNCQLSFPRAGTLRVSDRAGQPVTNALLLDLASGQSPLLRVYPLGQTDDLPTLMPSPDGQSEWVLLRDGAGFFQLYQGAAGAQPSTLTQTTFLTAQHASPHFSPDGQSLLYFTRDPISGYVQLFRIQPVAP